MKAAVIAGNRLKIKGKPILPYRPRRRFDLRQCRMPRSRVKSAAIRSRHGIHDFSARQTSRRAHTDVHQAEFQPHSAGTDRQLLRLHRADDAVRRPDLHGNRAQRLRHTRHVPHGHQPAPAADQPPGEPCGVRGKHPLPGEVPPPRQLDHHHQRHPGPVDQGGFSRLPPGGQRHQEHQFAP